MARRLFFFNNTNTLKDSRRFTSLFACFFALTVLILSTSAATAADNRKYASIVIDYDTGAVLHERHADKKLHPASLTKVMTILMMFDALEDGRMRLNDRIRISRYAASMQPSKLGLEPGETIRVKDAIYALVTKSANDVAVAVAEHLAGSERKFAEAMTRRAHAIGMARTVFINASGLHSPHQISTAHDMARMAQYVIQNYPEEYKYFSRHSFTYNGKTYRNHNRLLGQYAGVDGMKTGYVNASGFNLIASAVRNDRRIIGVVFGGRSGRTRNIHMASLLDRGFKAVQDIRIAHANAPIPVRKPNIILASANLNKMSPSSGNDDESDIKVASIMPSARNSVNSLIEQGDSDPAFNQRIEAGLIAISAYRGEPIPTANPIVASYSTQRAANNWSIQIGAYNDRQRTDGVIHKTLAQLPGYYRQAKAVVSPLRTHKGDWLYRARLKGYTRAQAFEACSYLSDCIPLAP